LTNEELVSRVTHRLRASLAVIAGYSEIAFTRDDPALRAEAKHAVSAAVAQLTDGLDDVMLALELAWEPPSSAPAEIDLREAAEAAVRRGTNRAATVAPGEPVWALADHESVVRALQALLRAVGAGPAVVTIDSLEGRALAAVEAPEAVATDDEALSLRNALRLAEFQRGAVRVEATRLELELPSP